jgi:hypothetical protein
VVVFFVWGLAAGVYIGEGLTSFIYYMNYPELCHFPVIFQTRIYTDLHRFDFDQILSITNLMESYDIDHNNLKSV